MRQRSHSGIHFSGQVLLSSLNRCDQCQLVAIVSVLLLVILSSEELPVGALWFGETAWPSQVFVHVR